MTAVLTRRSIHTLRDPAPSDREFTYLLKCAAAAPDHGRLRPWRWVLLRDAELEALGARLAADAEPGERARVAQGARRAPLKAVLIFCPLTDHKVPEWEQLAAASSVAYGLMLLLHARGFGSMWRTGRLCRSPAARDLLGVGPAERLLGALDIGTSDSSERPVRRSVGDVADRVRRLGPLAVTGPVA
ncbi:nitroreductase family protein [Streptomyces sp. TG1A-8]|uniref:nitroreductase family protein n=1 Tax=Streptomyces sp. TG1A-8 TaxID=3051385 RepID=UPI00265BC1D2|nr:nitroreductase family protein [Streptomyces sp. TG1A-8]MDO0929512.1 nitroreductase family protein [Streptomyces sp. TG1A-8]